MELSSEDILRLNVLLANKPQAIRIDDSRMVVCGLNGESEARIKLNPVGRADTYLRRVRELLSGQVLGSPGGYPVYLKRWTRMGQMRDESLEQLLLLGEPEAVVAAVCAPASPTSWLGVPGGPCRMRKMRGACSGTPRWLRGAWAPCWPIT